MSQSLSPGALACLLLTRSNVLCKQVRARSEDDADDELLCCCVAKSGTKVVTGSLTGVLALYSWGFWNDCSDRFPGRFLC